MRLHYGKNRNVVKPTVSGVVAFGIFVTAVASQGTQPPQSSPLPMPAPPQSQISRPPPGQAPQNDTNSNTSCFHGLRKRKEIRSLTPKELETFTNAVKQLYSNGVIERLAKRHNDAGTNRNPATNNPWIHGCSQFLPWHRKILWEVESELKRIDSSIDLPYWDSTIDSQSPFTSQLFSPQYFGGNGRGADFCVQDGPFANTQLTYPNRHCLKRRFVSDSPTSAFADPGTIAEMANHQNNYDAFRRFLEFVPHPGVHNGVGGNGGDMSTMYSPNDFIFFLHHAFIDKLWYDWQNLVESRFSLYEDRTEGTKLGDSLYSYRSNDTIKSMLDPRSEPSLCYEYEDSYANLAYKAIEDEINKLVEERKKQNGGNIKRSIWKKRQDEKPSDSNDNEGGVFGFLEDIGNGINNVFDDIVDTFDNKRRRSDIPNLKRRSPLLNGLLGGVGGVIDGIVGSVLDIVNGVLDSVTNLLENTLGGALSEDGLIDDLLSDNGAAEQFVEKITKALNVKVDISTLDEDERKLKMPMKVSEEWLKMNHLDPKVYEAYMQSIEKIINRYNSNKKYVSPAVVMRAYYKQMETDNQKGYGNS
ncbi:hypothetical protein H4219_003316 [Mycoemilia scoparia]|uniref:Tyrosinase copper-binding domain-containing protein n=1 Tax=Mycoemilia scoparia TaxID=417184 RepID=A0A9W8DSU2_9FUNG|nr:hypothetical protein H4219_003316 [Mycoemilia scoparia]